ncbi:hypothetical protein RI129_002344 [Pyrocoelia pectoralis]|uniref:Uncharacterized protein n=1 Tax=Pyrocoelia pectoralis TaxID=417401 RepID=A0AAN7ZM20_9COLE
MDIVYTKVIVAILFGIIRFLFGIFPIYLCMWLKISGNVEHGKRVVNKSKRQKLDCSVVLVQSFGGGVLFATCFLHMIPEVNYSVEELKAYGELKNDYPYAQLVVSAGFFLIYFVEELSQFLLSKVPKEPCTKRIPSHRTSTSSVISNQNKIVPEQENGKNENGIKDNKNVDEEIQTEANVNAAVELELNPEINAELEEIIEEKNKTKQQIFRCILIVLALSFHAIFEGLAIGLQNSITNIWYLFTAVSIHSATILFCIGLEIFLAGTRPGTILIHMFFLAITSPVGVVLGITISLTTELHTSAKSFAVVLLEGLSAGTILYITFFEVLNREKERRVYILIRAAFLGAGFSLMAGLECIRIE